MITLYGIKACDTMKKARTWLDTQGVEYRFHDYKMEGIGADTLSAWCSEHGWEIILNRQGTTFRKLSEAEKSDISTDRAIALMQANPSMIKRPVLDIGSRRLVGFKPDLYAAAFE
ncbi:ArsC family reductase [Halopseudomonas sp.]|uniref:ArsC family reductase n=1 Tax=Halopseudomonas sp. TaxID=2901191 RepID=UPI003569E8FB